MKLNFFRAVSFLLLAALICEVAPAQNSGIKHQDRVIAFTVNEGTRISVDVSPDGQTIIFDLLGHIYSMPISGGKARALTNGSAWSRVPRYSPDGKQIAMIRDGDGQDEIWLMPATGGIPRQLTSPPTNWSPPVQGNPTWTADGKRMIFIRDAWPVELYQHDLAARVSSQLLKLDRSRKASADVSRPEYVERSTYFEEAPVLSPDGRNLYVGELLSFAKRGSPGSGRVVVRYALDSGERTVLTEVREDVCASTPQLTRDGRQLAYLSGPCIGVPSFYVRDLESGATRRLLELPLAEARVFTSSASYGLASQSAYSFTPDGKFVVISFNGRIYKVPLSGGPPILIPFTVDVSRKVAPLARARTSLSDGPVEVRAISWPRLTPDGRRLVFSAVGRLWVQELSGGAPKRLTSSNEDHFEYMPALSPDGKQVAYVDFQRAGRMAGPGRLMIVPLSGGVPKAAVSEPQGETTYLHPSWSADGKRLAFVRAEGKAGGGGTSFGWLALDERKPHVLVRDLGEEAFEPWTRLAWFSKDGTHLVYQLFRHTSQFTAKLHTIPLRGGASQLLVEIPADTVGMMPSPDGRHLLVKGVDEELWLRNLPAEGAAATLRTDFDDVELRRITLTGAQFVDWQPDGSFIYNFGNKIYRYRIGQDRPKLIHTIRLTVPRHHGQGITAFRNARIITVSGQSGAGEVIENGTLVVEGRRIVAVGPASEVATPKGARVINATGLTLMPGLGDMHIHMGFEDYPNAFIPNNNVLGVPRSIAYGVTFAWEPLTMHAGAPALSELRESGRVIGPKWLYGNPTNPIEKAQSRRVLGSYEDVRRSLEHKRDLGATVVKEFMTARRDRRRWLGEAARELGLGIASHIEGLPRALSLVADGYTGFEHGVELRPLRDDVRQYLARTGAIWTPTRYSSPLHNAYWQEIVRRWPEQEQKYSVYDFRKSGMRRYPPDTPANSYEYQERELAVWLASGVKLSTSSHGDDSIKVHRELWILQQVGAPPNVLLRAGTMIAAEKMGLEKELGSLEVGKIADILVLKANPLDDVMNTMAIKYVMADGILYDPMTVAESTERNNQ